MPVLNSAHLLQRSLGSLVEQEWKHFEVLLVDGGSTDHTAQTAAKILSGCGFPHQVLALPASGIYAAINYGIERAKGDWVYVMGSDDRLLACDVLGSFELVLREAKPEVLVVHGDVWIEDPGYRYGQPWDLPRFLDRNISHQSAFYRRREINALRIRYDLSYPLYADWDYNIKVFSRGRFRYVPLPVASYACTGKSSQSVDERFLADKEWNAWRYFGWRAVFLMPPHRFALACQREASPLIRLQFMLNRFIWALRKQWQKMLDQRIGSTTK